MYNVHIFDFHPLSSAEFPQSFTLIKRVGISKKFLIVLYPNFIDTLAFCSQFSDIFDDILGDLANHLYILKIIRQMVSKSWRI